MKVRGRIFLMSRPLKVGLGDVSHISPISTVRAKSYILDKK